MMSKLDKSLLSLTKLDRNLPVPLYHQLAGLVRDAILSNKLAEGMRIPSSRALSINLNVSRMVVQEAYSHLLSEGFLETRVGDGTYISNVSKKVYSSKTSTKNSLNDQKYLHSYLIETPETRAFAPGIPDLKLFPRDRWRKTMNSTLRNIPSEDWGYSPPQGLASLRSSIAQYVALMRGIRCHSDQVVIMERTRQSFDTICRIERERKNIVCFENPGYLAVSKTFRSNGFNIIPIPIDDNGMDVNCLDAGNPSIAVVTPSHQFPMGCAMSLERRLKLLEWAKLSNSLIIEDDYDGEFPSNETPATALFELDKNQSVIYLGTFSKSMFPGLGISYAILPWNLVEPYVRMRELLSGPTSQINQCCLDTFIRAGHFASHVRQMRDVYSNRREVLCSTLSRHFGDNFRLSNHNAGIHVTAIAQESILDVEIARKAYDKNYVLEPLSKYYIGSEKSSGFIFGFGMVSENEIERAVSDITHLIENN